MTENRRAFLKKSLKIGTVVGVGSVAVTPLLAGDKIEQKSSGVVRGKAVKKEVLYSKNGLWEKYYKIAY